VYRQPIAGLKRWNRDSIDADGDTIVRNTDGVTNTDTNGNTGSIP